MAFEEEYAQRASAIPSLNALLEGYPLSAGIFRELVANSDDAGATKQVRVFEFKPIRF
jgi:sacsin